VADLATITAAIATTLKTVDGIGVVHDYERYATREKEFRQLFKTDNEILGGFFYRETTQELDGDTGEVRIIHSWKFLWFKSLVDKKQTSKSFQTLVENICNAFRADPTLGGVIDDNKNMAQTFGPVGIQVDAIESVIFTDVLCHRARLSLQTETTESKT